MSQNLQLNNAIIAHLYLDDNGNWHIQTNADHSHGVAEFAANFAAEFGMGQWGKLIGLLHDRGKERHSFQQYIRDTSGYEVINTHIEDHSHSHIGAIIAHKLKTYDALYWLSNPICGHHRGLYNSLELKPILDKPIPPGINDSPDFTELSPPQIKPTKEEASHVTRMLFSCLVDADWLDTERFLKPNNFHQREYNTDLTELKSRLESYRKQLSKAPHNDLNQLRTQIQNICESKSCFPPGFFNLTVPTGGGKTIAAMIWAINHALHHKKRRIIIAIPFTSIITQTAHTLREIFGCENVIEHHSAVDESKLDKRNQISCENWDAPIVVTTCVQLFESIYSNRPATCRKLHSLCNAVVIIDEVQSLPITFLQPIVNAIKTYAKLFGTSFLFSTASQPILDGKRKGIGMTSFTGIPEGEIKSIIDKELILHEKLRRVTFNIEISPIDINALCNKLITHDRVLCIVNSRKLAFEIFTSLPNDNIPTFHLSRMMCPRHILDTIQHIKSLLSTKAQPIRVISTQLIEAGVDIDFPVVYRQLAGLDSLLQAAGRCNREGHHAIGHTNVFSITGYKPHGYIAFATDTMKRMLSLYPNSDWFAPETMNRYYQILYSNTPTFDKCEITQMLSNPLCCQYEEAAKKFHLIDDDGVTVIVNYGGSAALVSELKEYGPSQKLSRRLGLYCVTISHRLLTEFMKYGLVEEPYNGFFYIPLNSQYDTITGLKTENDYFEQTIVI